MNKALLIGRLTKDPELRATSTGRNVCQFSIAVNKQAENLVKYQKKGNQIAVDGRIQTRNYEDKDGKRVYVTEILANNISFLDSKGTNTSSNDFNSLPEPPREDSVSSSSNMNNMETVSVDKDPFEAFGDSIEISDNDLPF